MNEKLAKELTATGHYTSDHNGVKMFAVGGDENGETFVVFLTWEMVRNFRFLIPPPKQGSNQNG